MDGSETPTLQAGSNFLAVQNLDEGDCAIKRIKSDSVFLSMNVPYLGCRTTMIWYTNILIPLHKLGLAVSPSDEGDRRPPPTV